jgi:hypothetical protein
MEVPHECTLKLNHNNFYKDSAGKNPVQISDVLPATINEIFYGFPYSLYENGEIVHQNQDTTSSLYN